jgi:predicted dehydrogenase
MNLNNVAGIELTALSDVSAECIKQGLEATNDNPKAYEDYHDVLKDPNVDAVVIAVPNFLHKQIVIEALEAGKHIFCEKPVGISLDEYDEIEKHLEKTDRIFQVGFELRHADLYQTVKETIESGQLGEIGLMQCNVFRGPVLTSWRLDDSISGGLLMDLCLHHYDLMSWFTNARPKRVCGIRRKTLKEVFCDDSLLNIEFDNGMICSVTLTLCTKFEQEIELGIVGDRGILRSWHNAQSIKVVSENEPREKTIAVPVSEKEYGFSGARKQWEAFVGAISENKKPLNSLQNARNSLAMALAAQETLASGKPVEIN